MVHAWRAVSTTPDPVTEPSEPPPLKLPFYRRPLVLIIAGAVVVVLIVGGLVAYVVANASNTAQLKNASASASTPRSTSTPKATHTATPTPTPTPTPPPVVAPPAAAPVAPPVAKPIAVPAPPVSTSPTITGFQVLRALPLCSATVSSQGELMQWSSTNAVRASLNAVANYPNTVAKAPASSTEVLDSVQGPLKLSSSCQFISITYTLTVENIVNGVQSYASATFTLATPTS
jgi:hypothetical protein